MNFKRLISFALCMSLVSAPALAARADAGETPAARQAEYLTRGGYGIKVDGGVYLSWRLLGTEPINQTFDIYRGAEKIQNGIDATNYTDPSGKAGDVYKVVPHNGAGLENDEFTALSTDYFDIMLDKPETGAEDDYTYEFNDAAIGDVDNDGEFEFIIKWDPTNRQDNSVKGCTGNVLIDCYKQDGTKLWRVDLGKNIRAGSHYTQIIVYDFDGDGKAEMALRTAPGSKDGEGNYVSYAAKPIQIDGEGAFENLLWTDSATGEKYTDESDIREGKGGSEGKILHGPDWLTMFDGETGAALATVNYYPQRGKVTDWGDNYANRSERYNEGVAYLDGEHPSLFTARGYYMRAAMAAYDWDGETKTFTMRWHRDDKGGSGSSKMNGTLYGNGDHQISVCDADNDGKDEIVFGSTVVDDDGSILNSTDHGHGDALHVSDFNNDGEQEIFQVHEDEIGYKQYGAEVRKAKDAAILGKVGASGDVGRGLMGNFDDTINDESEFFSSADKNSYNMSGTKIGNAPTNINPSFLVWWDGDLARELLVKTEIAKFDITSNKKTSVRSFTQVHAGDKDAPALSVDLLGDWREEVCYATEDNTTLRVFMTTTPTDYKMPTLLHDTQYREAIAWQNVGYNQPPHPKFYVGKAALDVNNKYLAPAAGFDTVSTTSVPTIRKTEAVEKPTTRHTVTVSAMGDINKTFNTYTNVLYGDSLTYTYPKFIVEDGIAYEAAQGSTSSSTHYGGSVTHVIKDQDVKINYTQKYGGVVYFKDFNTDDGRSAAIRASDGLGFTTDQPIETDFKLKPGRKYRVFLKYYNRGSNTEFVAGGKTLCKIESSNNTWSETVVSDVTVNSESPLTITPANGKDSFDIIMIMDETLPVRETVSVDLTSADTEITVVNEKSKTASSVTVPATTGDKGTKQPAGYIEYTPSKNGTLTFNFSSSATKNDGNKPRVYYCEDDFSIATKNSAEQLVEATGANTDTPVQLEVKAGTMYYIFGYLYNYTSDFSYTFSDFKFADEMVKEYPVKYVNYDGTVLQSQSLSINAIPDAYEGDTPVRADDAFYKNYVFTGWDKERAEISGETIFTAQFEGTAAGGGAELLKLNDAFKNDIQIEKAADTSGNISLKPSLKNGGTLTKIPDMTVYAADYNADGTLYDVQKVILKDGGAGTITARIAGGNRKIFIWTDENRPVTDNYTLETE